MTLQLRPQNDMARLFSALGDDLAYEDSTSLTQFEENVLAADNASDAAALGSALAIGLIASAAVAFMASWSAIRGYERNAESLGAGLLWGLAGFMFPIPTAIVTALKE
jgi:hypothetical protein